jgi:dipeptide transport system permease protein
MIRYIISKLFLLLPTFLGVTLLAFWMVTSALGGDPASILFGEHGVDEKTRQEVLEKMNLGGSFLMNYLGFLGKLLQGDLGSSLFRHVPVWSEFTTFFPATVELSFFALCLAVIIGIPLGVLAAYYKNTITDYCASIVILMGYSMPVFWWGLICIQLFSVELGWMPIDQRLGVLHFIEPVTGFMLIDTLYYGDYAAFRSAVHHLVLPTIVLSTIPMAVIARMTRASVVDVLGELYITTARAKGQKRLRIAFDHTLRNALLPIITVIGLQVGALLTGAVLTEKIFSWPGVGSWIVEAIGGRDYPVVVGGVLILSSLIILTNFIVDVLYVTINPKLRAQIKK